MKISDGYWMNKKGYNISYAVQIAEIVTDDDSVTVYAAHHWISNRSMTLEGPVFTVRFTSTMENSIKVTIEHFSGSIRRAPAFTLYENHGFKPVIHPTKDGGYELISGSTSVTIGAVGCPWNVTYRYNGQLLTKSDCRSLSLIEEDAVYAQMKRITEKNVPFYAQ